MRFRHRRAATTISLSWLEKPMDSIRWNLTTQSAEDAAIHVIPGGGEYVAVRPRRAFLVDGNRAIGHLTQHRST